MRVEFGPSELRIDALIEALGDEMLEPFCLVMDLLDWQSSTLYKSVSSSQ